MQKEQPVEQTEWAKKNLPQPKPVKRAVENNQAQDQREMSKVDSTDQLIKEFPRLGAETPQKEKDDDAISVNSKAF